MRTNPEHWEVHALLMALAAVLFFLSAGMASLRWLRVRWWRGAHLGIGVMAGILSVAGVAVGLWMVERAGGHHFTYTHSFLSAVALAVALAPLATGVAVHLVKKPNKAIRWAHVLLGLAGIAAMVVGAVTGLALA